MLIVIVGPTATGKSTLAAVLAKRFTAEIISADSRQIYKGNYLGTGKPSELELSKIPHHLISTVPPDKTISAADFVRMAEAVFQDIVARGKRCILVGGTGLWIKAFMDGLDPTPPPDIEFRRQMHERLLDQGPASLHIELQNLDPEASQRIHPSDAGRIIRALEILKITGKNLSQRKQQTSSPPAPHTGFWLGLCGERRHLYFRAEKRIDEWLEAGWADEIRHNLSQGLLHHLPTKQIIGFSHLAESIQGRGSLDQAVERIKRDTRHYIKRQLTWFQKDQRIQWLDCVRYDEHELYTQAEKLLVENGF